MSEEIDFMEEEQKRRPGFLTTLCVLSFISIGIGILSGLVNLAAGPSTEDQMIDQRVEMTKSISQLKNTGMHSLADLMEKIQLMSEDINDNFYLAGSLNLIIVLAGLFGVIKMLKGYKMGFHVYILYCLLSIGSMYAYVAASHIPTMIIVVNLIISGLFIFLYSRNLKWMTK